MLFPEHHKETGYSKHRVCFLADQESTGAVRTATSAHGGGGGGSQWVRQDDAVAAAEESHDEGRQAGQRVHHEPQGHASSAGSDCLS